MWPANLEMPKSVASTDKLATLQALADVDGRGNFHAIALDEGLDMGGKGWQLAGECIQIADHRAGDGTRKWLLDVGAGNAVEMVFIPEDDRGTLCISSQAGCAVNCRFCSTGAQGFARNLAPAEIIGQLWFAEHHLRSDPNAVRRLDEDCAAQQSGRVISNVVMMGMGEPLLNYDAVLIALRLMLDDHAYGLSRRRVTVSTSGVVPMMDRLAQDCPVALAVSLHAPNDALRNELVPLNQKYPLKELIAASLTGLAYLELYNYWDPFITASSKLS